MKKILWRTWCAAGADSRLMALFGVSHYLALGAFVAFIVGRANRWW